MYDDSCNNIAPASRIADLLFHLIVLMVIISQLSEYIIRNVMHFSWAQTTFSTEMIVDSNLSSRYYARRTQPICSHKLLINCYNVLVIVPKDLQIQLNSSFSDGDFVDISVSSHAIHEAKESSASAESVEKNNDFHDEDDQPTKLFTCPVDGCVKLFQRYSSLENYLQYGKCEIVLERENLFDKARIVYRDKLLHGSDFQPVLASSTLPGPAEEIQTQGWALKMTKKAKHFTEKQKCYLDETFSIGQETGHKLDAAAVACDMRFARDEGGNRRFTVDDFLTPQQVQSYFSRMAAKLKKSQEETPEEDITAAEDEAAYSLTCQTILDQCLLSRPITFESFNLCNLNTSNGLKNFSIAMLRKMCEYFDLDVTHISTASKAPYIELLRCLVHECSCALQKK